MLRRSRFVRRLGAVSHVCRRPLLSDLHRREALRTHHGGRASGASLRDFHNYLVTSTDIDGEWSDPIYLNSSGFDPSLFHDDDGRKYLVNMLWDHRPGQNRFAGIVLQEYLACRAAPDRRTARHLRGTPIGFTEGPHLYKRDGYYYLITAEGGTGWGHAVTMARSTHDRRAVRAAPGRARADRAPSAGCCAAARRTRRSRRDARRRDLHGVPVRPAAAEPRAVHARPRDGDSEDGLGRRRLAADRGRRRGAIGRGRRRQRCRRIAFPRAPTREDFDGRDAAASTFQWLRSPWPDELFSLTARPGHSAAVRARDGRKPVQAVARRAPPASRTATARRTIVEFEPEHFQQMAGLDLLLQQLEISLPVHLNGR